MSPRALIEQAENASPCIALVLLAQATGLDFKAALSGQVSHEFSELPADLRAHAWNMAAVEAMTLPPAIGLALCQRALREFPAGSSLGARKRAGIHFSLACLSFKCHDHVSGRAAARVAFASGSLPPSLAERLSALYPESSPAGDGLN